MTYSTFRHVLRWLHSFPSSFTTLYTFTLACSHSLPRASYHFPSLRVPSSPYHLPNIRLSTLIPPHLTSTPSHFLTTQQCVRLSRGPPLPHHAHCTPQLHYFLLSHHLYSGKRVCVHAWVYVCVCPGQSRSPRSAGQSTHKEVLMRRCPRQSGIHYTLPFLTRTAFRHTVFTATTHPYIHILIQNCMLIQLSTSTLLDHRYSKKHENWNYARVLILHKYYIIYPK